MIDDIYDYASDHPNFDTEFVDSLQEQLQRKSYLSVAQMEALENIMERFRIERYLTYGRRK